MRIGFLCDPRWNRKREEDGYIGVALHNLRLEIQVRVEVKAWSEKRV